VAIVDERLSKEERLRRRKSRLKRINNDVHAALEYADKRVTGFA